MRDSEFNLNDLKCNSGPETLPQQAYKQLQDVLEDWFNENPYMNTNSLAQRCRVSEPTLRRIRKGQGKRIPNVSTVIALLSYLSGEKDVKKIVAQYGAPLSDFISEKNPEVLIDAVPSIENSKELGDVLDEPVKYIIYKLSANDSGVSKEKIIEIFGPYGIEQADQLVQMKILEKNKNFYKGTIEYFSLPLEHFIVNFKATANFIKVENISNAPSDLSALIRNQSSSINKKAYSKILRIQQKAQRKIAEIMFAENSKGDIPVFNLVAFDTLDTKSADQF